MNSQDPGHVKNQFWNVLICLFSRLTQVCLLYVNVPTAPQTKVTSCSYKEFTLLLIWYFIETTMERETYVFIQPLFKLGSLLSTVGSMVSNTIIEFKVSFETVPRLNQLPGGVSSTITQTLEQTVATLMLSQHSDALTFFNFFIYHRPMNPGSNSFQSFIE